MLPASAPRTFHRMPCSPRSWNTDRSRSGHHCRHRGGLRTSRASSAGLATTKVSSTRSNCVTAPACQPGTGRSSAPRPAASTLLLGNSPRRPNAADRSRRATVREFTVPATITIPDDATLTDAVYDNAKNYPDTVSFSRRVEGQWQDVTAARFADEVTAVAKGLIASDIRPGDRVALMSRT